jgi:glycosyltransferase involved in cell wall biosynthesis
MSETAAPFRTSQIAGVPQTANVLLYVHMRNIYRSTGAGRVARQMAEYVSRRPGMNVHVLADRSDHDSVIDKVGEPWTAFPYHLFSADTSIQQRRWLLLQSPVAERYWPEAQIVHCMGESYVPTAHAKLVVTVHDAAYFDKGAHPATFATWKQSTKWRILYKVLARKVDIFYTISRFSADRLSHAFPSIQSRLRVVYNGVPDVFLQPFTADRKQYLQTLGLLERPYVLFPGGLNYRKNADLLFKAWPILSKKIPDLLLIVPGHCDPVLAEKAAALGNSVRLLGFVEDEELHALYAGAQVVWFPSKYEGFGMPVVEAMASGAPVVASNSTSIPEIAGDAGLLVDTNSVAPSVDAIESLIHNSTQRAEMIRKGRVRARQFTWDAAAAQLHDLYSSLI